ncbi:hypothetical protein EB151_14255, partial [archaeon]|nr:hypothetical protein [archaeon]
ILLVEGLNTGINTTVSPYSNYIGIFEYQSIETSTTSNRKHIFKGVAFVNYIVNGNNRSTIPASNSSEYDNSFFYNAIQYNLYYIDSSTINNIPFYQYGGVVMPFSVSFLDKYDSALNTWVYTGNNSVNYDLWYTGTSSYNGNFSRPIGTRIPLFTFKPHIKQNSTPIGILGSNGDYQFFGIARKSITELWDDYAWNIIDKFNKEFNSRGIFAKCVKGSGPGEFNIIYPDGYAIDLFNGKYGNSPVYSGMHQFSPKITDQNYTRIAIRDNENAYLKNQIQLSRRKIPEITTLSSYISVGKPEYEFIAMAGNVDDYIVFKEDGIFRLNDNGNINPSNDIPSFSVFQISTTLICQAKDSVAE